jgi:hypothetical protein
VEGEILAPERAHNPGDQDVVEVLPGMLECLLKVLAVRERVPERGEQTIGLQLCYGKCIQHKLDDYCLRSFCRHTYLHDTKGKAHHVLEEPDALAWGRL